MYGYWLGMNVIWWVFWLVVVAAFFTLLTPVPRGRVRENDPLAILKRRYAAGELTTAEFDERRSRLLETTPVDAGRARAVRGTTPPPPAEDSTLHTMKH